MQHYNLLQHFHVRYAGAFDGDSVCHGVQAHCWPVCCAFPQCPDGLRWAGWLQQLPHLTQRFPQSNSKQGKHGVGVDVLLNLSLASFEF